MIACDTENDFNVINYCFSSLDVWIGLKWNINRNPMTFQWVDFTILGAITYWNTSNRHCTEATNGTDCLHTMNCVSMKNMLWRTSRCSETFQALCISKFSVFNYYNICP